MKKTRIIKQSIFLDVYGPNKQKITSVSAGNVVKIRLEHSNLSTNISLGWLGLPDTNALAYLSKIRRGNFLKSASVVDVAKLMVGLTRNCQRKNALAYSSETPPTILTVFRRQIFVVNPEMAVPLYRRIYKTWGRRLKPVAWTQCHKNFYVRNLLMFVT